MQPQFIGLCSILKLHRYGERAMSLRVKVGILSVLIFSGLITIMLVGIFTLESSSNKDNAARVRQLLQSTYSTIEQLEIMAANGDLSDAEARKIATKLVQMNIYSDSEYVYVADENLDFVATPLEPEYHGTSFHEFKDSNNKSVGDILLNAVNNSNEKIVEYPWSQRKADDSIEQKLSVAMMTPRWKWVVGTGIGFQEVNARFWASAKIQMMLCILITGIIAVPFLLGARNLLRGLGGELKEVMELVQAVSSGNLRDDGNVHTASENSIYGSVVRMRQSLREMLSGLTDSANQLTSISDNILSKAQQSDASADSQSRATDMIASSAEEFNVQTQQASQHADAARNQTTAATDISATGESQIAEAVQRFSEIDSSVGVTQSSIDELAKRVDSISAVISVISEVANQTNLLALNAAIEAARAGDQGRGFAVVADEVRQLAGRTSQATQEISDTITSVQDSSKKAKSNMDEMVSQLKEGIEQTKMGGEAVKASRTETDALAQIVEEISQVLREQVEASDIIRQYVHVVENASTDTKQAASDTLAASQDVRVASERLTQMARQFSI